MHLIRLTGGRCGTIASLLWQPLRRMIGRFARRLCVACRLAAKGARNIILKEMWNIGLKGPARTIEEIGMHGRRRHGRKHQNRDGKAQIATSFCQSCFSRRSGSAPGGCQRGAYTAYCHIPTAIRKRVNRTTGAIEANIRRAA
jgi:hypothetical protein